MADNKKKLSRKISLNIYRTEARDLTVVRGKTGIIYPFYRSTGANSLYSDTWFPWMGYFDHHPQVEKELYMVKPDKAELSGEVLSLIGEVLGGNMPLFTARIGNDEALAISSSLGGGIWNIYPELCQTIQDCEAIEPYLLGIINSLIIRIRAKRSKDPFSYFEGLQCTGSVCSAHAALAKLMEDITREEAYKLLEGARFSIQDKKEFPTRAELQVKTERLKPTQQLTNWGVFKENRIREFSSTENSYSTASVILGSPPLS